MKGKVGTCRNIDPLEVELAGEELAWPETPPDTEALPPAPGVTG